MVTLNRQCCCYCSKFIKCNRCPLCPVIQPLVFTMQPRLKSVTVLPQVMQKPCQPHLISP